MNRPPICEKKWRLGELAGLMEEQNIISAEYAEKK